MSIFAIPGLTQKKQDKAQKKLIGFRLDFNVYRGTISCLTE